MPATVNTITIDTANALQTLNAAVSGVQEAPQVANYRTALDTVNCPYVIVWPLDGRWYVKGGAARQSIRTWLLLCYIEPVAQSDIPSNLTAAMGLLDKFINLYTNTNVGYIDLANPPPYQLTVESGPDMQHTDGGIVPDLAFRGVAWYGFRLRLNVRALW